MEDVQLLVDKGWFSASSTDRFPATPSHCSQVSSQVNSSHACISSREVLVEPFRTKQKASEWVPDKAHPRLDNEFDQTVSVCQDRQSGALRRVVVAQNRNVYLEDP